MTFVSRSSQRGARSRNPRRAFEVADLGLAADGVKKVEWAERRMTVVGAIGARLARERPLAGLRIAACLHVTSETAALLRALQAGGAEIALAASNPLTTQDDVAAALVEEHGIRVFGVRGESSSTYARHLRAVAASRADVLMDDGGDLLGLLHGSRPDALDRALGATEDTTTGVTRLRALERRGLLRLPVLAVNEARGKYLFGNRLGTGQSAVDGVVRATGALLAGRTVVVAGYGWCGRGVAARAAGAGARVVVSEVDPIRALEAAFDGFDVLPMGEAARVGDVFVTATGCKGVIRREHLERMRDGAVLANTGHFDVEVDVRALAGLATLRRRLGPHLEEIVLADGRRLHLLADGRLVNLAAAEGHPPEVMDLTFANQALAVEHLARHGSTLAPGVHAVPDELDAAVARLKLATLARTA